MKKTMPSASGQSGPPDIIGREDFIASLWHILEERSLILSAERRFGKTYVIQKMEAEPPQGVLTFYQDMSDVHTVQAFSEKVCAGIAEKLPLIQKTAHRTGALISRLSGGKVNLKAPHLGAGVPDVSLDLPALARLPWKEKLTAAVAGLVTRHNGRVVFFWDEVPWMIGHIKQREGAETALEALELLRVLRQDPTLKPKLRMVYTGSIGFHHVLDAPPVNDMKPSYLPPLEPRDAEEYARRRLAREAATVADASAAREIAEAAGGVPFYIYNLVQSLSAPGRSLRAGDADTFIAKMLKNSPEEWELPHYDTRIDTYYTPAQSRVARDLLDILAVAEADMDFAALRNLLSAKHRVKDEAEVRHVLDLLRQDHYLWPDPYRFQLPLVRRYWRVRRGL